MLSFLCRCESTRRAFLIFIAFAVFCDMEAPPTLICSESCKYSQDGDCDDGGFGSDYIACTYGTDCKVGLPSKNDL